METGMNTLQKRCKHLTMSPHYLVQLKTTQNNQPLPAVRSVELIAYDFLQKVVTSSSLTILSQFGRHFLAIFWQKRFFSKYVFNC